MPTFQVIEAQPWHCGQMSRLLRAKQQKAASIIGFDLKQSHRELKLAFDMSVYRRAWLIDGKLAGMGGVMGTAMGSFGMVWLAFSEQATRYPLAIIRMVRDQLDEIMQVKRLLLCTILEGDPAAERLAIFLGFVPADRDGNYILPAASRYGRKEIARQMAEDEEIKMPCGSGYAKVMAYRQIEGY